MKLLFPSLDTAVSVKGNCICCVCYLPPPPHPSLPMFFVSFFVSFCSSCKIFFFFKKLTFSNESNEEIR